MNYKGCRQDGLARGSSAVCSLGRSRISAMHTRCLIECYGYLGVFVDDGNWQDGASLDSRSDDGVGLAKRKTC